MSAVAWRLVGVGAFLLVWDWIAYRIADVAILPPPRAVFENFLENFTGSRALEFLGLAESSYLGNLWYTLSIVVTAWAVGSIVGFLVGVLASRLQLVRDLVEPVLYLFGVVPVLVAAPFFLIWFGFGRAGQWALVAFFSFVVVTTAALVAAVGLSPRCEEYSASLGLSAWQRVLKVVLPQSAPTNLAAMRVSLAGAWGLQAVAELLGSQAGVGRVISVRASVGDVASVMAMIIALGVIAVIADLIFSTLAGRALAWQ